ncbi:hypothetical protein [Rubinisphaera sp. JC750]|uniref:hypothetical protein n=1 Tax=Rubinisphaera sp. JC750 TaxID=2898658 RepID=UPI001F45F804|nr:hypothetical protein [Rubinisphaera sp. JC750]
MIWSSDQFFEWLSSTLGAPLQQTEQWVWGGLVLGFLFASVHLLTMLVTRWGDHHASSKSLLFSVLIHLMSGAGVIVFAPGLPVEKKERDPEPIQIQDIMLSGTRQTRDDQPGNTPAWEAAPTQPKEITRAEREIPTPEPSAIPEREQEQPEELLGNDIGALDMTLPRVPEQPQLAQNDAEQMRSEAADIPEFAPAEVPDPAVEMTASPEETRVIRSPRPDAVTDTEMVQRPESGGADRLADVPIETRTLRSPDLERGPVPAMPDRGEIADAIERRQAPEQTTDDGMVTGQDMINPEGPSAASDADNRAVTRSSRNSPGSEEPLPEMTRTPAPAEPSLVDAGTITARPSSPVASQVPLLEGLPKLNFDAIRRGETAEIPATYRLRDLARRKEIARRNGGTDASEEAVERSLAWLASIQEEDGRWDGSKWGSGRIEIDEAGINRQNAGVDADMGLTGLTVLAFLGAGYTQEEGKYSRNVDRAIDWLISQQREDGYLGGNATRYAGMYCHGMAAYALGEAYGMRSERRIDDRLSKAVAKASEFTIGMQNQEDGGWRYLPGWSGDMSMFGWQMMALKSAEIAGVAIPSTAEDLMVKFLVDRSLGENKGLASYHPEYGSEITAPMTAEAMFCKQMLGIRRDNPASQQAAAFLLDPENRPRPSDPNLYYWYYGTLAMYQYGGDEWTQWNVRLRELLIESQSKRGPMAGSWDPEGPWGGYGGRVYSTALATLSLEVYYRFLPLYRISDE